MRLSSGTVRRRRLLLVDPDAVYCAGLEEPLEMALWSVHAYADASSALSWLADNPTDDLDAVWCEVALRDLSGEDLIMRVRELRPALPAMIVSSSEPASTLAANAVRRFSKRDTAAAVRWLLALEGASPLEDEFVLR